jgi:hypothetical protein
MPLRTSNSVERNTTCVPTIPVTIPAATSTLVLNDISTANGVEYAGRYIQNVGSGACYYAIGHQCDKTNFNGVLFGASAVDANGFGPGQQLDVSNVAGAVYVYSVAGTTIATTLIIRNDNAQGQGGIL